MNFTRIHIYGTFYVHIMYVCMYMGFVPEINLFIFVYYCPKLMST